MNRIQKAHKRRKMQTNYMPRPRASWLTRAAKEPTRAAIVGVLLGAVLAYAGYYFVLAPFRLSNGAASAELAAMRDQNALARTIEKSKTKFEAERWRDVAAYAKARRLLPDSLEVTNVLNEVQEAAA